MQQQYMQRVTTGIRMQAFQGASQPQYVTPYMTPQVQPHFMARQGNTMVRATPRWTGAQGYGPMVRPIGGPRAGVGGGRSVPRFAQPPQQYAQPPRPIATTGGGRNFTYKPNVRNVEPVPMVQPEPEHQPTGQEPLSAATLAGAQPQEQKQMLGERLYPHIQVQFYYHLHSLLHHL